MDILNETAPEVPPSLGELRTEQKVVGVKQLKKALREGRAQSAKEALAVVKEDLKKLNADVQVEQEEYDEVVAIKPMFLLQEYK